VEPGSENADGITARFVPIDLDKNWHDHSATEMIDADGAKAAINI
jgi:hypothetical protein